MEVEKLEGDVLLVAHFVAEDLEIGALLYYGASEGEARYPCPARGGYFRLRKRSSSSVGALRCDQQRSENVTMQRETRSLVSPQTSNA